VRFLNEQMDIIDPHVERIRDAWEAHGAPFVR
jgi:hypothetical protein